VCACTPSQLCIPGWSTHHWERTCLCANVCVIVCLCVCMYSFTVVHSGVEYTPPEKTYLRAHVCVVVFMCACVDQKSFTVMHSGVEYAPPGESLFVRMCMCMCMCVCMCVCVCVLSPVPCQAAVIRVSESTLFC
jgi:hypothetical protein